MRRRIWIVTAIAGLLGSAGLAWAVCSSARSSSYQFSRPMFTFGRRASPAEMAAARARAEALRRQKMQRLVAAIGKREAEMQLQATERRRDNLEAFFDRAYGLSPEQREAKANELYETGRRAEQRRDIEAAKDYYLFTLQIAPGTDAAVKAHAALQRLAPVENAEESYSRDGGTSAMATRKADDVRRAGAASPEASEGSAEIVEQMLEQLGDETDLKKQLLIIQRLRDEQGAVYSEGLTRAIEMLSGEGKEAARQALEDRFVRMTPGTLRSKLADTRAQVLLAAIGAAGRKQTEELVPDLGEMLVHKDEPVRQRARNALKQIADEDFGPNPGAGVAQQYEARKRWRAWWDAKHDGGS